MTKLFREDIDAILNQEEENEELDFLQRNRLTSKEIRIDNKRQQGELSGNNRAVRQHRKF
ncbi:MAG: hypothetical protein ACRDCA_00090 [Serratia sp. (in: enterobacteria)]|uniref:hypothetical protein n=1 Tax=Serratia sp. (in: enterobacteria) TaxID=616 RepID=UPI003F3300AF